MQVFIRYADYTGQLPNRFLTKAYDARLLFIVSGKGEMHFADRVEPFKANTFIYYPAGYAYLPSPDPLDPPRFVTINFDFDRTHAHLREVIPPVAVDRFDQTAAINSHVGCGRELYQKPFVLPHMGDLKNAFLEIAETFSQPTAEARETAEALLQYVLCRLATRETQKAGGLYERILTYVTENITTVKDNNEIAAALNYHPYYINQFFKAKSGKTLHKYIMELRLQKGAAWLRSSDKSIAEIAFAIGFKNADHFSKCFKEYYHVTPTAFRRSSALV